MSFQEDCERFGEELARLVDAGVPVKEAAIAVGVSRRRCYAILRAINRPVGKPRSKGGIADHGLIVSTFEQTGSVNRSAKACGVAFSVARRILVEVGLVPVGKMNAAGKPEEKRKFLELIGAGWSTTRAAAEVGVNERTGQDWRQGIRKTRNRRIHPDGRVVDYKTGTVYKQSMTRVTCDDSARPAISDRYLSIED